MDEKPFFTLDLNNIKDSAVKILSNFTKTDYSLETFLESAEDMKYVKPIRSEYEKELTEPSDEFVKLLVNRFFDKPVTAQRLTAFRDFTRRAISSSLNDSISLRLKSALHINEIPDKRDLSDENSIDDLTEKSKITTTQEKIEGSQIIKAILRELLPAMRISVCGFAKKRISEH